MTIGESATIRLGTPVYQDAVHVISVCENTILTYSSDAPNTRYLVAWARTVESVAEQYPDGILAITLIDRHARAPDDVSKAHIRNTVLRHAAEIKAFAYVVEGEGFGAAAIRSALSLMSLAARYPFPMKVFGRVEDAAPWVLSRHEQHTARAEDAVRLVNIANSLRDQRSISATG
jgi:hypothetical protein